MNDVDAVIIGSGPNGLAAAIELARNGAKVAVFEAATTPGGGLRTAELTLPGFHHDFCSAVHPMGVLSPYFKKLPLEQYGLKWIFPEASVAHPLDDGAAVLLTRSLKETALGLGNDAESYVRLLRPFVTKAEALLEDALAPLTIPKSPFLMARFGMKAIRSATGLANSIFKETRAKALFAGCAAHSILPLEKPLSAALGMMFTLTGHVTDWPVAAGGSQYIADALTSYLRELGGDIITSTRVTSMKDLPPAKAYLFDTDPLQLMRIASDRLPNGYVKRLQRYHFGPGAFKVDWALDGPIPWKDPNCLKASTVHIGGTIDEIASSERDAWYGRHHEKPFVLLCQQSQFDTGRAPEGKHTGYAYCHVPNGSDVDRTEAIENQIERFAPGFKDIILKRHTTGGRAFSNYNPNYVGGAITGGVADLTQLFTRPVARFDPYSTPDPKIFICSASTPPGGGVHGMCGYYAAKSALKRI
ncbi:NAD(P)/FAD-dependent oxidoreductase [Fulvivirga sp. M361]|uniref:phytoene desaturase family protein n=1 Tax=Fulvivirga sp. M361 TaxID=2594266 RepID=UPI00117A98EB|nr:NAD(P)/FAD-dependent oxidoreductase [Fulvivirga sp. M361]TRX56117.1 NAD(P)/FAD-dependent oxidoreductase [Fulvivirga sp. M361]